MKVTNWRKKLATTLVAAGLMSPAAAHAAALDTNLVANPGFESVDPNNLSLHYNAPAILNWSGGPGFVYSHDQLNSIPNYAGGEAPPNAGHYYFSSNDNPAADDTTGDWRAPDGVYQDIPLNAGATQTQIASGEAGFRLSGFMSSYRNDSDNGNVQVDFKNAGGTTISSAILSDPDFGPNNIWSKSSLAGLVPAGTASMRVSIYGTSRNNGADGYIDNVDVQLTSAASVVLFMEVNTNTGQVAFKNQTGQPVKMDYYEVTSASGALKSNTWSSLQDQNRAGFPSGNGTGNGWEEAGGSGTKVLSESDLTGNSSVANAANIGLGAAFNTAGAHDLVFKYGLLAPLPANSDFNGDGVADGADFLIWQRNLGKTTGATHAQGDANGDLDYTMGAPLEHPYVGAVDASDLAVWKSDVVAAATAGSVLTQGFVRYVTTGPVSGVPEPSAVILVGMGLTALAVRKLKNGTPG